MFQGVEGIEAARAGWIAAPSETAVESAVQNGVEWLRLTVELCGAALIGLGVVVAVWLLVSQRQRTFNAVRLTLAKYLALALEFQLGADILSTAVAPSWDKIGKLGAIAIIRTGLNFFLTREMREEREGYSPPLARQTGEKEQR